MTIRPRRSCCSCRINARALERRAVSSADGTTWISRNPSRRTPGCSPRPDRQGDREPVGCGSGKRRSGSTPRYAMGVDDVTTAGKARPDGILISQVYPVADLNAIANRLSDIIADMSIRVWAMIETARAVLDAEQAAAASKDSGTRPRAPWSDPDISRETASACSRAARR